MAGRASVAVPPRSKCRRENWRLDGMEFRVKVGGVTIKLVRILRRSVTFARSAFLRQLLLNCKFPVAVSFAPTASIGYCQQIVSCWILRLKFYRSLQWRNSLGK